MLPGLLGSPLMRAPLLLPKWPDPTPDMWVLYRVLWFLTLSGNMHKHILKMDLFWYCSVRKMLLEPWLSYFFPLNLLKTKILTIVVVSGAVTALLERRRIQAKPSATFMLWVCVNSVHSHTLLTGLKVFVDCCIKSCVWGKYFRWCEVFSSSLSLYGKHLLIHKDLSCTLKRKKVFPSTLWGKYFCVWAAGLCMNTPIPGQDEVAYK